MSRSLADQTEEQLGGPRSVLSRQKRDHVELDRLITAADGAAGPAREAVLNELCRLVFPHAFAEEDVLLPRLQAATDRDDLVRLGTWWQIVRATAPTRPHPVVARRPPGNALAAAPLTVLDRFRDLLDAAARSDRPWSSAARSTSHVIASAAGRVEHIPPLTRGERPATKTFRTGDGS